MIYSFGDYRLDPVLYELYDGEQLVSLEPQVFDVLSYLVQHHERVVPKQELLDHIWPERYITEAALNSRLMSARKAIGDNGRDQRWIKTLHGRGYRFVGEVSVSAGQREPASTAAAAPASPVSTEAEKAKTESIPGREAEMAAIRSRFDLALDGRRQVVFVTGEAGLGKTTLVSSFSEDVAGRGVAWVAQSQCLDYHGAAEPYLPILDALSRLCRSEDGPRARQVLSSVAPSWLLQMPWFIDPADLDGLRERASGTTRARMLREITEALDALAAVKPLVLLLDDLQWSDHSTIDVIASVARRPEPARLMVLATFRPSQVNLTGHPVRRLRDDLRIRGQCAEIAASYLTEEAIASYLCSRLDPSLASELAPVLHRRTGGSPLFIRAILDSWVAAGHIAEESGARRSTVPVEQLAREIPETIHAHIGLQLDSLDENTCSLLQAASVAGASFTAAAVAPVAGLSEDDVETICETLAATGAFVVEDGLVEYAGGMVSARYVFGHDLVREVLYERIPWARRSRMHVAIGNRLEELYGPAAHMQAAELAVHFREGRDGPRATTYLLQAANLAMTRSAEAEAIEYLEPAIDLLAEHPAMEGHQQLEMAARAMLGVALIATNGFAPAEAEQSLRKAITLARELGDYEQEANCVYGLAALYEYRGEHPSANEILRSLGRPQETGEQRIPYHALMSCCNFHEGQFKAAVQESDQGVRLPVPERHAGGVLALQAILGENPFVGCREWSGQALWFLGFPDRALSDSMLGLEVAQRPEFQYSLAGMLIVLARVHQMRREPEQVRGFCERTLALAREYGYPYHEAAATMLNGWARSLTEASPGPGIEQLRRGLELHGATGAGIDRPYFMGLLADALLAAGDYQGALLAVDDAFASWPADRPFFYIPELHRLRGEVFLQSGAGDALAATAEFERALDLAQEQESLGLALRAATSLARLHAAEGRIEDARQMLQPVYARFSEGFGTADLRDARALLEELSARV